MIAEAISRAPSNSIAHKAFRVGFRDCFTWMRHDGEYWKRRCELAEKYIDESPCDPDTYDDQITAYRKWMDFKK